MNSDLLTTHKFSCSYLFQILRQSKLNLILNTFNNFHIKYYKITICLTIGLRYGHCNLLMSIMSSGRLNLQTSKGINLQ
jgi:hypothetical protein